MIGFCIEASHRRGLGHLYKTLNFVEYLAERGERSIVMVNDDQRAIDMLKQRSIKHVAVNLDDMRTNWETTLISNHGITVWINDRLDTDQVHARNVKNNNVTLVTFDDRGSGAALADLHFAPMVFSGQEKLQGKRVFTGAPYLILSKEIDTCKRWRQGLNSILVTLGGSDTYGVTIQVVNFLKTMNRGATVVIGPAFQHHEQLKKAINGNFCVKQSVPSLIQEFTHHDLAITGGGITPFEANASGLPCLIIANERHEIEIGHYLAGVGSSVFVGYYRDITARNFDMNLDIERMSSIGIAAIVTSGTANIFREIEAL